MKYRKALLAALIIASSAQAAAASHAEVAVSGLTYRVVDLDPTDGTSPVVNFGLDPTSPTRGNLAAGAFSTAAEYDYLSGGNQANQASYAVDIPHASATATLLRNTATLAEDFTASATITDGRTDGAALQAYGSGNSSSFTFILPAKSQLVVTLNASILTETNNLTGEFASASAYGYGSLRGYGVSDYLTHSLESRLGYDGDLETSTSASETWEFVFSNTSENVAYGGLNYRFYAVAVSGVPEPSTYGMLLGGLALVGFAARRRA